MTMRGKLLLNITNKNLEKEQIQSVANHCVIVKRLHWLPRINTCNERCMVECFEIENFGSKMQILKCTSLNLDVINVYRSKNKSLKEATELLRGFIDANKPTLIVGDFNVCARTNRNNVITHSLINLGFVQLAKEATQIEGNTIDHVYWMNVGETWEDPIIERYSPYFSDHDAHLITLTLVRTKEFLMEFKSNLFQVQDNYNAD